MKLCLFVAGYPSDDICERAKTIKADLIVIGKHAKTNIEDLLLVIINKGVVYTLECDVLVNN